MEFPPLELEMEGEAQDERQGHLKRNESHESFDSMQSEGSLL